MLDPYGESPLAALFLFQTETATQVEILIHGGDEDTGAAHTFAELSTQHVIPVYGLYPGQVNIITIEKPTTGGRAREGSRRR